MAKLIAVTGATGSQGGGVVNIMKKTAGWNVRAVTRNPASEAARTMADQGIEVVQADFDDEASLQKAFEGVSAVFAVTNWWEWLFRGKTQEEAGEIEERHGVNIAKAAAKVPALEHYIWSTCPSAKIKTQGKHHTPHMDYKANVDARIKSELPELAAKTTYLYLGYYPQNIVNFPMCQMMAVPNNPNTFIQTLPTRADAKILLAGDMAVNPGLWVRQVLASGARAYGKYSNVALERWSFQQMVDCWSEVTGKRGVFVECSPASFARLWGPAGCELGLQLQFGEMCDPWEVGGAQDFISAEELGIDPGEVVGCRGTIEGLKQHWVTDA